MDTRQHGKGFNYATFKSKCTVYDVKEKDPTKKVIKVFESVGDCATFLGLTPETVHDNIKNKRRNRTNKLNKVITIR